jgi:hypothetical protein
MKNFNIPDNHVSLRDVYSARVSDGERTPEGVLIDIIKTSPNGEEERVHQYTRNYSALYRTFEPFRQYRDGVWKNYALLSTEYVRLAVMDLESFEIIATEAYPVVTQEIADRLPSGTLTVGEEKPGWGFCPVEFYVPDLFQTSRWSVFDPQSEDLVVKRLPNDTDEQYERKVELRRKNRQLEEDFLIAAYGGQFGIYTGCIWGDDSSWKIRYVDLSRIHEGIVTTDERFGYVELGAIGPLRNNVTIRSHNGKIRLSLPVAVEFEQDSGAADKDALDSLNAREFEDDDE